MARDYKYCPHCAARFTTRVMHARERLACPDCGFIFWQNPVVGVAVIVLEGTRILLGRRKSSVFRGQWCIPCGYVEYDEDVRAAAAREFLEETGLSVKLGDVYTVHSNFHNPEMHSVGIWFRGEVTGGELGASDDLDAVSYVPLDPYPSDIAFPTDRLVLDQLRKELLGQ